MRASSALLHLQCAIGVIMPELEGLEMPSTNFDMFDQSMQEMLLAMFRLPLPRLTTLFMLGRECVVGVEWVWLENDVRVV